MQRCMENIYMCAADTRQNEKKKQLYIVMGPPGAGKSTYTNTHILTHHHPHAIVVESDTYQREYRRTHTDCSPLGQAFKSPAWVYAKEKIAHHS